LRFEEQVNLTQNQTAS